MTRVLLVDDHQDFLSTMGGILTDAGYEVIKARNEGKALDAALRDAFDYALVDVRLHGEDELDESGSSLALALQTLNPGIRIILLTGYLRDTQITRALRFLGVMEFLEKTPDLSQRVLEILSEAEAVPGTWRSKSASSSVDVVRDTRFTLSLEAGQPVFVRCQGQFVSSVRSSRVFQTQIDRYAMRTEVARHDPAHLRFQINEIGRELWRELFREFPEVIETYKQACAGNRQVSLVFETSSNALRLPLEFLRSGRSQQLALQHPLSRFLCDAIPKREALSPQYLARTSPLRVLIIASNTEPSIDGVDVETSEIYSQLDQHRLNFSPKLITTKSATLERARTEFSSNDYDIIHYAGHGWYNAVSPEESEIYFWTEENRQGYVAPMKATELADLLTQSSARLVYLSSCWGTASGDDATLLEDDFLGLADAIAQAGVPSVLGFRWPVSDIGAPLLAKMFYESLLESGSPEMALWRARRELASRDRNDPTWMSPILIHQA